MENRIQKTLFLLFLLGMVAYSWGQKVDVECQEGINLLPMYGKVQKCKKQLESDQSFLSLSDKEEPNRLKAGINMMDNGWYYLHQGDYDTAMKRFNQAWLLDSTNIAIYASFACVLDLTEKTNEAIEMLDFTFDKIESREEPKKPTPMNPSNALFIEFIIANAPFTYKKTNNSSIGKYLYKKLDSLELSDSKKESLKSKLKSEISDLD